MSGDPLWVTSPTWGTPTPCQQALHQGRGLKASVTSQCTDLPPLRKKISDFS